MWPSVSDDDARRDTGDTPNSEEAGTVNPTDDAAEAADVPQSGSLANTELKEAASATDEPPFPLADAGPYYIGLWEGHPNYKCPYCMYATLEGDGAVELHILEKIDQGSEKHAKALNTKEVTA